MTARPIWRLPPFAAYLATQGSWFFAFGLQTALFPYVARVMLGGDSAQVGLAQTSLTAPAIVLVLLAGVIAERLDRRLLLGVLHLAAIAPPATMGLFLLTERLQFPVLISYGLAMGVLGALMMPTRDAALNAVAKVSQRLTIQRAVVLASLVQFIGQIAGMAVASAASASGPAVLMFLQASALGLGAAATLSLPALPPARTHKGESVGRQLVEGLAICWRSPEIRPMVAVMFSVGVFVIGGAFLVLLPVLVLDVYGGLAVLGLVLMTFWAGAAFATVILARRSAVSSPGRALALTLAVGAASVLLMMVDLPYTGLLVMVAIWGASGGFGIAMSRSIVQEAAPQEALGRVLSVYQLGFLGGAPIGALIIGFAANAWGLRTAALIPMFGVLATAVWLRFFTPIGRATPSDWTRNAWRATRRFARRLRRPHIADDQESAMSKANKPGRSREELSQQVCSIAFEEGTERPFTGPWLDEKRQGVYRCVVCDAPLWSSEAKYDSGSGWPSFTRPIGEGAVETKVDYKIGVPRTEVHCASCGAHMGHVFDDGPGPEGKRYCINGTVLDFAETPPEDKKKP